MAAFGYRLGLLIGRATVDTPLGRPVAAAARRLLGLLEPPAELLARGRRPALSLAPTGEHAIGLSEGIPLRVRYDDACSNLLAAVIAGDHTAAAVAAREAEHLQRQLDDGWPA